MRTPNAFTSAFVPFVEAILPEALSAALASSSSAAMLASVRPGVVAVVFAGVAVADVAAAVSVVPAESYADLSPFAHAASTAMLSAATSLLLRMFLSPWLTSSRNADRASTVRESLRGRLVYYRQWLTPC